MTADPPPSSEGSSLPSRHRPVLGDLAKNTTELDLWSFDDELEDVVEQLPSFPPQPRVLLSPQPGGRVVPERRDSRPESSNPLSEEESQPASAADEQIRVDVNKSPNRRRTLGDFANSMPLKRVEEFDDLEQWDAEPSGEEGLDELPEVLTEELIRKELLGVSKDASAEKSASVVSSAAAVPESSAIGDDEFSVVPREGVDPVSLRPHLGLTIVEKMGVIILAVLLLAVGVVGYLFSVNRLPTESIKAKANDFPIKGSRFTVNSSVSYWRVPIVDGPTPDVFRRGTVLLPVVEIAVSGGSGAIRVVFRDESGKAMGDSISRSVKGEDLLKIIATAGFEDMGMYAAYRTGGHKPWTIEVLEGPLEDAPSGEFKKLYEMELSTAIR